MQNQYSALLFGLTNESGKFKVRDQKAMKAPLLS